MESVYWKQKLNTFLVPHPIFIDSESKELLEDIYTPRQDLKIRFWFEGNLQIKGEHQKLEVNYNVDDILVLSKRGEHSENIYRVPWNKLISFELIIGNETSQKLKDLVRLN